VCGVHRRPTHTHRLSMKRSPSTTPCATRSTTPLPAAAAAASDASARRAPARPSKCAAPATLRQLSIFHYLVLAVKRRMASRRPGGAGEAKGARGAAAAAAAVDDDDSAAAATAGPCAVVRGRRQCLSVMAITHTTCMTWRSPMRSALICRTRSAPHADADDDGWAVHAAAQDAAGRTQPALQQSACCGVQAPRPHAGLPPERRFFACRAACAAYYEQQV
jgi:hypothetical protein